MTNEHITEEEADELLKELERKFGEGKMDIHSFLTAVVKAKDTTRLGNIKEEELGMPDLPIRTLKELEFITGRIPSMKTFNEYFTAMSEAITAPSLSKEGFLIKQATIQRKEFSDKTKPKKENKGWFKKKEPEEEQ